MVKSKPHIKVIGFDADDTLWLNEVHYRNAEKQFAALMEPWLTEREARKELFRLEMQTLSLYGYGAKGFTLSMISAAISISSGQVGNDVIRQIIDLGNALINAPLELLDNVDDVLAELYKDYKLIVATKGDLLDQEGKMKRSGIASCFHHIEVMSDKQEEQYVDLLRHLEIEPSAFLMIGNSMKSDILPPLKLGASAIHVPFHTTWAHEEVDEDPINEHFTRVDGIREVLGLINH